MKQFNFRKFAQRLTLKQREFRMTVKEAAAEIKIGTATLSRLNREKMLPDVETYYKCCVWLETTMDFFFD